MAFFSIAQFAALRHALIGGQAAIGQQVVMSRIKRLSTIDFVTLSGPVIDDAHRALLTSV